MVYTFSRFNITVLELRLSTRRVEDLCDWTGSEANHQVEFPCLRSITSSRVPVGRLTSTELEAADVLDRMSVLGGERRRGDDAHGGLITRHNDTAPDT